MNINIVHCCEEYIYSHIIIYNVHVFLWIFSSCGRVTISWDGYSDGFLDEY